MQLGDRLLCAFIENQTIGFKFKDWPLHVTIVPWFRVDIPSPELANILKKHYVGSKIFSVSVIEEAEFGYKKRKVVNLLSSPELMRLEGQSRRFLHAAKAWVVDEADKTRRGFRPHVTVLGDERLHEGDIFTCDRLYIISQHGEFKQVDSAITFSLQ